jgi:AcrR family transcriptional regulator
MARAGLTPARVVSEAAALADERGVEALSLASLADRLGVRVPSLYKHVDGLGDLRRRLALQGLHELADAVTAGTVGRAGPDALRASAAAYRTYAGAHPGVYAAIQRAPMADDPEWTAAASRIADVLFAVLHGYGPGDDELVHAARAVRSALHGFVTLERLGGFGLPQDVDASFDRMLDLLDAGLRGINE